MLNVENLNLANGWANNSCYWSLNTICEAVAGVSYYLAAPKSPRNFEIVFDKFILKMVSRADGCICQTYMFNRSLSELMAIIREELFLIKEFREWNLTSLEFEHGVDPEDDRPNEWWDKSDKDFIDLEAFMQNVYCNLRGELVERHFFDDKNLINGTI